MKKYYGNYLGIVVGSGDDPENRNRIQVWVPHITNTLYEGWNYSPVEIMDSLGNTKTVLDRDFFNFQKGNNIPTPNLIDRIRNVLPWAECASPLFGGGSPVTQNFSTGQSSIDAGNSLQYDDEILDPLTDSQEQTLTPGSDVDELLGLTPEGTPLPELAPETGGGLTDLGDGLFENLPQIPDTPANNAPGSGEGLPPVEPDLPTEDTADEVSDQSREDTSETIRPLTTPDDEDITFPTPATRTDPSLNVEGQTPDSLPPVGGGGAVIQRQAEVARSRRGALNNNLVQTIERGLAGTGLNWISTSGTGQYGVGGSQHRIGNATDGYFVYANGGQTLNPNNAEDRRNIANALYQLTNAGIGGIGWDGSAAAGGSGSYYMGDERFHLDVGGAGRNWGHTTRSNSAAGWVVAARNGQYNDETFTSTVADSGSTTQDQSRPVEPDDFAGSTLAAAGNGGYDGTSTGTYSVPDVGSKVWIFFHGGDIQKPVYFAQALDPSSFDQTTQGT